MGQINTNNYPTVNSLLDADLLIVENATNGTGTTTPKQLRENAIGTGTLQTSAQTVTGAINELKHEIDLGAGVICYDVDTITNGYLGQFSGSANLLLLHLTTDGTADATNGYMMMLSYSRPVARFAYGRLVDADGVAYKQDVYADNTIICKISDSGEGTESDPKQVVILGIINAGFMLTPTAVVSDRDIIDGQGNTLSVLAEALTKTASGNPVVITDCAGGKARSLKTTINAIQDLHGLPFPYVGGAYKNKLPYDLATMKTLNTDGTWNNNVYTDGGVSFTVADGVVYLSGTATKLVMFYIAPNIDDALVADASYILTGAIDSNIQVGISQKGFDSGSGLTFVNSFTISDPSVRINIASGTNTNNKIVKPMIRLSTESDASFAPYSNICPISGRTAVNVDDVGHQLWNEDYEGGAISAQNGQNASGFDTTRIRSKTYSKCIGGESVYAKIGFNVALRVFFYASDYSYISYEQVNALSYKVITVPANAVFFKVATEGTTYGNVYRNDISVNTPSTFTDYVPYAHSSATIQLGQTVYGADINWDTGVMTVKTAKIVMNGEGDFAPNKWATSGSHSYRWYSTTIATGDYINDDDVISSYLEKQNGEGAGTPAFAQSTSSTSQNLYIFNADMLDSSIVDTTTLCAYLQNNPLEVTYKLANPATIQLTPEQLEMLKGTNRLTIDSGSIEVGYIAKLT